MEPPWPQKVILSPANPGDIFRRDQVGAEGCQLQAPAPVPSPPPRAYPSS